MVTRRDQEVGSAQGEPIERRLRRLANGAVIDPTGRLVQDGDHRDAKTAQSESRTANSSDRVEQEGVRPELLAPTKHRRAASGERERPFGE